MSLLDSALDRIEKLIDRKIESTAPFRATVASVSGGMATIKRLGTSTAETESRARIVGMQMQPDDEVLCLPVNGKPVIIGKIQRETPTDRGISYRLAPWRSGIYYDSRTATAGADTSSAIGANTLYAMPMYLGTEPFSCDRIAITVNTGAAGSARLGVYADTGAFFPGALLDDHGTVDISTTGVKAITISATYTAEPPNYLIWLAVVTDVAVTMDVISNPMPLFGVISSGQAYAFVSYSFTYAALPSTYSGAASPDDDTDRPRIMLRKT